VHVMAARACTNLPCYTATVELLTRYAAALDKKTEDAQSLSFRQAFRRVDQEPEMRRRCKHE